MSVRFAVLLYDSYMSRTYRRARNWHLNSLEDYMSKNHAPAWMNNNRHSAWDWMGMKERPGKRPVLRDGHYQRNRIQRKLERRNRRHRERIQVQRGIDVNTTPTKEW